MKRNTVVDSFRWNENYETGFKAVDEQHRRLVDLINSFGGRLSSGDMDTAQLDTVFDDLIDYTDYHFREEEQLMDAESVDSRHRARHHREHMGFLKRVTALRSGVSAEDSTGLKTLLDYLIQWLAGHILGSDLNMAGQIRSIRTGMDPKTAYETGKLQNRTVSEPLVSALGNLFDQLAARNRELETLNRSLEEKVAERTRELTEANLRLEELALTDPLTGLPNRRSAVKYLQELWEESCLTGIPISCLMIDADHFKEVNDSWGHDAGDQVLRELSRVMGYALRNDDTLYRLGGDEFFIICRSTGLAGALKAAASVLEEVTALSVPTGSSSWKGSVSVGAAEKTPGMVRFEEMIKSADDGVYAAKKSGRCRIMSI